MAEATATVQLPGEVPLVAPEATRKIAVIISKGALDMAYPGLILANAARMSGIEATLFFTFWGLDVITEKKIDHLHLSSVGNPSLPIPTMVGGLPFVEAATTSLLKKQMAQIDVPSVREMLQILSDSGAHLFACGLAMQMFKRERSELIPQVEGVLSAMDFFDRTQGAQLLFI